MNKAEWRKTILQYRKKMSEELYVKKSASIYHRLIQSEEWQQAQHIALYFSINREVDTIPFIQHGWSSGKSVYLPKCNPADKSLTFYQVDTFEQLEVVYFGIPEPIPAQASLLDLRKLELVLVPGLVFDRYGYRIGYGGGFYDRFLARLPGHVSVLGIAFAEQVLEEEPLPTTLTDWPVHKIVTDREWLVSQEKPL